MRSQWFLVGIGAWQCSPLVGKKNIDIRMLSDPLSSAFQKSWEPLPSAGVPIRLWCADWEEG